MAYRSRPQYWNQNDSLITHPGFLRLKCANPCSICDSILMWPPIHEYYPLLMGDVRLWKTAILYGLLSFALCVSPTLTITHITMADFFCCPSTTSVCTSLCCVAYTTGYFVQFFTLARSSFDRRYAMSLSVPPKIVRPTCNNDMIPLPPNQTFLQ